MAQCTAHSKRTGERCLRSCAPNKTTCYYHGGAPRSGRPITHGKRSRWAKPRLRRGLLEDLSNALLPTVGDVPEKVASILDRHIADGTDPTEDLLRLTGRLADRLAHVCARWIPEHPACGEIFSPGPLQTPVWDLAAQEAIRVVHRVASAGAAGSWGYEDTRGDTL